jgi:hypothetical protein
MFNDFSEFQPLNSMIKCVTDPATGLPKKKNPCTPSHDDWAELSTQMYDIDPTNTEMDSSCFLERRWYQQYCSLSNCYDLLHCSTRTIGFWNSGCQMPQGSGIDNSVALSVFDAAQGRKKRKKHGKYNKKTKIKAQTTTHF